MGTPLNLAIGFLEYCNLCNLVIGLLNYGGYVSLCSSV